MAKQATDYMQQAQDSADSAIDTAQEYADSFTDQIRANPLTAVLVALGLGWLFGIMTKWR